MTEHEQHEPDTCRPVEIDGELIRVRGAAEMSDEARAALAEVIGAAKRKYAAEHPADRLTVDTITSDQLDALYDRIATLEAVAAGNKRHVQLIVPDLERAEATIARVRALSDRWAKAGAPPLGTPLARWVDARLIELNTALDGLPTDGEEQAAPVDWQAVVARRERELKTVAEARHRAEAAIERVRAQADTQRARGASRSTDHKAGLHDAATAILAALDEPKEH